jgi:hypothetical protein
MADPLLVFLHFNELTGEVVLIEVIHVSRPSENKMEWVKTLSVRHIS